MKVTEGQMRPDPVSWEDFENLPPEAQRDELFRMLDDQTSRLQAAENILRDFVATSRVMSLLIWLSGFTLGVMFAKVYWHIQ
jgi:hypothetical protein